MHLMYLPFTPDSPAEPDILTGGTYDAPCSPGPIDALNEICLQHTNMPKKKALNCV